MSEADWQTTASRLTTACASAGFDLVHAFGVGHYHQVAPADARLADFGLPNAAGFLIGNTRALWPSFVRKLREQQPRVAEPNPLDAHTTATLASIAAQVTTAPTHWVFSHVTRPRAFPLQRLAELVGFAALSPSHLAIHPQHGPWWALRAVLVCAVPGPEGPPAELVRPCQNCAAPCVPALERAIAASGAPLTAAAIAEHAADWIAVRDACPVGQSSRYGEEQIAYHYGLERSRIGLC